MPLLIICMFVCLKILKNLKRLKILKILKILKKGNATFDHLYVCNSKRQAAAIAIYQTLHAGGGEKNTEKER